MLAEGNLLRPNLWCRSTAAAQGLFNIPIRASQYKAHVQVCLAKHHSLAVCQGGELYSWGSNRDGRLGYLGPDSQPTPRRYAYPYSMFCWLLPGGLTSVKYSLQVLPAGTEDARQTWLHGTQHSWPVSCAGASAATRGSCPVTSHQHNSAPSIQPHRCTAVPLTLASRGKDSKPCCWPHRVSGLKGVHVATAAAANRHTVVAASDGRVFSWGSNLQGQLGYGTSDSASNASPRLVEAVKVSFAGMWTWSPSSLWTST